MKLFAPILLSIFALTNNLHSQTDAYSKEMVVSYAELNQNGFEADTTANALVIYEKGNSYVDKNSFKLITKVVKKVKIFNRSGFEHATVTLPLYQDLPRKESITDIKGATYNLVDNKIQKTDLDENGIFEERYNERYNVMKFTFPNINEGSVITYSYTMISPFFFNFHEWEFQDDIPKLHSEYHTSIPGNWDYHIKLVGLMELDYHDRKIERNCIEAGQGAYADCTKTIYMMKNIPAFKEEGHMTTRDNYLARIDYELKTFQGFDGRVDNISKTWKNAETELKSDTDLGRQLRRGSGVKGMLDDELPASITTLEKAKFIYSYVQNNYNLNDETNLMFDVSIRDILKQKSGNAAEINILLHNLLDEYDIEVNPVLISTREHGLPTQLFPIVSEFNYLIIQATIDNKTYLLDATNDHLSFGEIPFKALNQVGRLLDFKGESKWINIEPKNLSIIQQRIELEFDENEELVGTIKARSSGYHSLNTREQYFSNPMQYTSSKKDKSENPEILEYELTDGEKNSFTVVEEYEIKYKPDVIGDKIFVNPFLMKFFEKNPFQLQQRTYPIDFGYKDTYLSSTKISFGENYTIESIPENFSLALPNNTGTLLFSVQQKENAIEVYLKFDFKQVIYNPEYYPYIKKFVSEIVNIEKNSLISLKKK